MPLVPVERLREAAARLSGKLHRTPLVSSAQIGALIGVPLFLKCESLQKTGSFKPRGALNKILSLTDADRARGIVTVSAGNHAQAVAWASRLVGAPAVVVMPSDAPRSKLDAVRGYGAEIVLHDDRPTLFDRLRAVQEERGLTFVHPFDDPVVLAGAGTVGLEILEDLPEVGTVVVHVGGGGLLGGIASAVKQLAPRARIVAVELEAGPGLGPALAAGRPVPAPRPAGTLCDGMTPPFVGALPLEIAREAVDEIVTVSEGSVIRAMGRLMTRAKLVVEGSGAAATAALLDGSVRATSGGSGGPVVAVVSGANIDLSRLPRMEEPS